MLGCYKPYASNGFYTRSSEVEMEQKSKCVLSKKHIQAFTLIELLVVIAVIALLMSIIGPALNKAKEKARQVICTANIRQQGIAMNTYASDNNNKYPVAPAPGWWPFGGMANWDLFKPVNLSDPSTIEPAAQMALFIQGYMDDPEVFYCPSAKVGHTGYINYEEHWDKPADDYPDEADFGWRCFSSFTGYPTWAGYGYDTAGRFDPAGVMWSSDEERWDFKRKAAKDPLSSGSTVALSDIILEIVGPDAPYWNNHSFGEKSLGGNVQYNDGSAKWSKFSETELLYENPTRSFNFRF